MLVNWLSFITIYLNINAIIYTFLKYTFLLRFVWCCFNEQITKLKQNKIVQYKSCCYNAFLTVKFCFNFKASSPPPPYARNIAHCIKIACSTSRGHRYG